MIKVLIAEDDAMFRYAIRTIINWESYDYTIVAEAVNGKHALELIERENPEILLTDISMPQMNGIELIKYVRKTYPEIIIGVLSAYNDFEFVKEALKMGAEDYILKYDLDSHVVLSLMEQLKNKVNLIHKRTMDEAMITQNMQMLTDHFIHGLLTGDTTDNDIIEDYCESLGLGIGSEPFIVVAMEALSRSIQKDRPVPDKCKYIKALFKEGSSGKIRIALSEIGDNIYSLLIPYSGPVENLSGIVEDHFKDICKDSCYIYSLGISHICNDICEVNKYYKQACKALNESLYQGKGKIYFYSDIKNNSKEDFPQISLDDFYSSIRDLDISRGVLFLTRFFDKMADERVSLQELNDFCRELSSRLDYIFDEQYLVRPQISLEEFLESEDSKNHPYYISVRQYYIKWIEGMFGTAESSGAYSLDIRKTITYIHKNYTNNIQLNDLAEQLMISPNYLCSCFKKETGVGIVAYINSLRIEKAKRLIKNTSLRIYEIADKVGFLSPSYFATVFKNTEGCSAHDYRNEL